MARLAKTKAQRADDFLSERIIGTVSARGRGNIAGYVDSRLGIKYRTYCNKVNNPSTIDLGTLRVIADALSFTDADILKAFGRA